jgi:glycosyltransferase involved in cell wall biosynthesis
MRLLYWTESFHPYIGGVEVLSSYFLRALQQHDVEVEVLTSHGVLDLPDEDAWEGVPVHRVALHNALQARDVNLIAEARSRVAGLKRAFAPDLVHLNVTAASVYFERLTRSSHACPLLISMRVAPNLTAPGSESLLTTSLLSAAWVTANSQAIADDLRGLAPEAAARISVIMNGLAEPSLAPAPLPTEPPVVVCVGRLVDDKGFDVALDAFAHVIQRVPAARLIIAGDGPAREALGERTVRLGLQGAVEFAGWVAPEQVPALMNRATVAVVPSRCREAFGLVALEAALMARPVVATRVGGLPEVVLEGETGLLVASEQPQEMARAICSLLLRYEYASALGARGRNVALDCFSLEGYVDAHLELYERLCG